MIVEPILQCLAATVDWRQYDSVLLLPFLAAPSAIFRRILPRALPRFQGNPFIAASPSARSQLGQRKVTYFLGASGEPYRPFSEYYY